MSGFSKTSLASVLLSTALIFNASAQYRDSAGYDDLFDSETASALRAHVRNLSAASLEGRAAGSQGEAEAASYLEQTFKDYGIDLLEFNSGNIFGINNGSDTLTSRNVVGFIQGSDPKLADRYIVVGARMDNRGSDSYNIDGRCVERIYSGANGNASGMALMLELARMLGTNAIALGRSVLFVGFGASSQSYAGAWYFLNRQFSDSDRIDAMVNLDCVGTLYNGFYAYTASNNDLNTVLRSLEGELLPLRPEVVSFETYPSDHRAFYAREIPSISFSTGKFAEYNTERDTGSIIDYSGMEKELEYVYACVVRLSRLGASPLFHNALPDDKVRDSAVIPYYECDVKPTFLNSSDPRQFLTKWVYAYLKYPREAVENGIQGTVMVEFIIGADGKVRDARVVRSVSELLDAEALKVVSASPKWKPGKVKGVKVPCSMTLPVEFRLEKSRKGSFGINDIIVTK